MANEKYTRRKKGVPVSQKGISSAEDFARDIPLTSDQKYYIGQGQQQPLNTYEMGDPNKRTGNLSAEQAQYMRQGMRGPKYDASVPPSQRAGGAKSFDADKKRTRDTREIGGASGLLSKLERGEQPVSNAMKKASDAKFFKGEEKAADMRASEKMLYGMPDYDAPTSAAGKGDNDSLTKRLDAFGNREKTEAQMKTQAANKARKKNEEVYSQFGMDFEEGGEVKSKVMTMLDGMKDMPAEAEVVKMIVEKHGVSEDQAKAMIAEYKKSKMGMGGKTEYEGGGAMKMMRDPKDMVGMAMGGARIIS